MRFDVSDLVAFISLAILATVFGLLPPERVMQMWIRKRQQVALIWTIACLHRGAELLGQPVLVLGLHRISAVVACLAALTTAAHLLEERRRGLGR